MDLPYKAEYAKTGRAGCKKCKSKIDQGVLRLAAMVQSYHHDGKDPHWFHFRCFFEKHRPKSVDEIDHFENVKYEDQEKIREKIGSTTGIILPETSKAKKGKKRTADEAASSNADALKDFGIEYSKSSRAECVGCNNKIMKEDIRVKKTVYDTEVGIKFGGQALWHHLECFVQVRSDYGFYVGGEDLPGFRELSPEDKKKVKKILQPIKITATQAKKLKAEPKDEVDAAIENALEETIKKQTKQFFKIRELLQKDCKKADLQNILFKNNSGMVAGVDELLDRCADFMTFGAIDKCDKCKQGDMIFSKYGYTCNGADEWAACANFIEKPKRSKCRIPSDLKKDESSFLAKYKPKVENRAVRPGNPNIVKKQEKNEVREPKVKREREPLYNMHVVALGSELNKEELKTNIMRMGGKLVTKIQEQIAFVISTKDEIEKMNERMKLVKSFDIQVVPDNFLDAIKGGTPSQTIELIKSMAISEWGSDPLSRIPQEEVREKKESMYNEKQSKVSMKLKNGTAIDPESGLEDVAHVYRQDGVLYTSILSYTDIQKNKNSYYKLQMLESDAGREYWVFRSWGRIGTKVGDKRLEKYPSAESACDQFETLFEDKTGNMFNGGIPFKKLPGKYYPVEVDYDDDEKVKKMVEKSKIPSKLKPQVRDLVNMLFDVDTMKQTMLEFELDLEKMPLGRLSKKQLHDAYQVLTDLNNLVSNGASNSEFIGLSNKFFTLVPHNFGMNKAPVIDTLEMIQTKRDILDNLIEVEIAYSMLQQDTGDELNPLDAHYEQLKTNLKPMDHESEDFKLLKKYVENTHAATHKEFALEVIDVFAVERQGEKRRFKPFKKLHNRQLLWHGSRMTNYVGILSHGLKIAPPEAPVTGYMFGKGIYFADSVSKSANYCATSKKQDIGLMLLSEVALGDMHELTAANERIKKPPEGKHSVKGLGKSFPNDSQAHIRADGVKIPLGTLETDNKLKSSLLYNEYIVYDVAQVNIQYLLKMKFHYKKK